MYESDDDKSFETLLGIMRGEDSSSDVDNSNIDNTDTDTIDAEAVVVDNIDNTDNSANSVSNNNASNTSNTVSKTVKRIQAQQNANNGNNSNVNTNSSNGSNNNSISNNGNSGNGNIVNKVNSTPLNVKDKNIDLDHYANNLQEELNDEVGSGDLDVDLNNWYNGVDKLPSAPLTRYVSNRESKTEYGLSKATLSNYDMMSKLRKFLDESFDYLFNEQAMMGLDPDDLMDRVKVAFTMYKELNNINQKTYFEMNAIRHKYGTDKSDRLDMLLSSIPSDKLKKILEELMNEKSK